jgi:hypothetical protein
VKLVGRGGRSAGSLFGKMNKGVACLSAVGGVNPTMGVAIESPDLACDLIKVAATEGDVPCPIQ